ncbi:MAG: TRAP transporter large permease [Pseudomonadota bacterium]
MGLDQAEVGLVMIGGLIALLLGGMPIAFALALSGIVGLILARGWRASEFLLSSFPYSATAQLTLIIIPLFLFMGHLAFASGLSAKAFDAARALVGRVRGGLAIATVFACGGFATVSGSSVATAATMARIAIPEMLASGYKRRLAAGCVAAGGTLGVLIPPSGVLVIYSIATGAPLTELLIAAVIPGVLTALAYGVGIHLMVRMDPASAPATTMPKLTRRQRLTALGSSWELGLLFFIVMGSIYLGFATPTEAAAVGAFVALVIAIARSRGKRGKVLKEGLIETGVATSSIFALVIGAGLFSLGLSTTQIPQDTAAFLAGLDLPPTVILLLILVPFLVLGAFIDGLSMILLTMPVVYPVIEQIGVDPILFGILVTKTTEIGVITPPVGLNVFVVKAAVPNLPIGEAFRGAAPFVVMELILLGILIAIPELTLGLLPR